MKILVESHIPFIRGVLEAVGEVTYLAPEDFTPERVRDADALVIRTRTRCDAALLNGSRVRSIATATIGTDHIDLDYCRRHGIAVHNAPGCNAPAVAQYVLASMHALGATDGVLGIVGVGHVGSIVQRWAQANGIRTMLCDPPRAAAEGPDQFVTLHDIAERADVITFHTPLDATTRHMAGRELFDAVARKPLIINAARGPIVDTPALIETLEQGRVRGAVIDCWEGEPRIDRRLLELAAIATPHIAGYSLEGKQRATAMAVRAIAPQLSMPMPPVAETPALAAIARSYDPVADTKALRSNPNQFELLRNRYVYRPEPTV